MKIPAYLIVAALLLAVTGCGHQDFGGVITGPLSGHAPRDGGARADQLSEIDELARSRRLAKVLGKWKGATNTSQEYHVGINDSLEIGILAFERPGVVSKLVRVVDSEGNIELQWIGATQVSGLTVMQIRKRIARELDGRFIRNPQVSVSVAAHRSRPVLVTGAVGKPGIYHLSRDRRTVLEMLAEANGLGQGAGDELMIIRGAGHGAAGATDVDPSRSDLITVNLEKLLDDGDLRLNYWVQGGDMIAVPPRARQYVYVIGYIQRPGSLEMSPKSPMTAWQAVAMSGGPTSTARPQNSTLLRAIPDGKKLIPIDLMKVSRGKAPDITLQPGDTLVVGTSFFGRLQEFIRPTVGIGASYAPGL